MHSRKRTGCLSRDGFLGRVVAHSYLRIRGLIEVLWISVVAPQLFLPHIRDSVFFIVDAVSVDSRGFSLARATKEF